MKIRSLSFILVFLIFSACSKSNTKSDSGQVKVESDTSTLLKSSMDYNLGADGVSILDSSFYQWTYDDQRRIVEQTFAGSGYLDTFNYSYLSDRYVQSSSAYLNGQLVLKTNAVYYQLVRGHTDSLLSTSTGYGLQAGDGGKAATYFYYNQNNQDTLENSYGLNNDVPVFSSSIHRYYTGSNLDSVVGRDNQGNLMYIEYFLNGNPSSESSYNNNVLTSSITYIYSDISSGGLSNLFGSSTLLTSYTSVTIPATTTFIESVNYQFDAVKRVSTIMRDHHGASPNQKEIYTYY